MAPDPLELARARRECDLYRRLLDLGHRQEPEPFLKEALGLIVDATEAGQGYIELYDEDTAGTPLWSHGHGFNARQVKGVRAALSRGIIAQAVASGRTVVTESAVRDERFSGLDSVSRGRIEAVLCAPIGDDPPRGVLYLQNRAAHGVFTEEDRTLAETFAFHLALLVDRLLACHFARTATDHTAPIREALRSADVIGQSNALAGALRQAALVAPLDVHVFLTGETGTGKSQLARVIHNNGPRASHPFVTLNCAALPETLMESELFGALPGAHSTATRKIVGKVEAAERGTLFLDEIGELSYSAQAKLLHLLQAKEYYPLGATRAQTANVRVIAATNIDLKEAVAQRRFREDLFYRLQVLPIRIPSLGERRGDIPLLAAFFCAEACARNGLPKLELSPNAMRALESTEWPGNVRQLENAVEAAVIRATGERVKQVERRHLFPESPAPGADEAVTFQEATRRFQGRFVAEALETQGWNVVETARRLDLARSHLYTMIRAFGLERRRP